MIISKKKFHFSIISALFFFAAYYSYLKFNLPYIKGEIDFSLIVADSKYFYQFTEKYPLSFIFTQSASSWMVLLLYKLFNNLVYFFFMNFIILCYAVYKAFKNNKFFLIISFLILFNPIVLSHVSVINKDIFGLISVLFVIINQKNNKSHFFYYALIFSILSRWSLTIVLLTYFLSKRDYFKKRRLYILTLLIILSSFVAYFVINYDTSNIASLTSRDNSLGLLNWVNNLSSDGFYFLVLPIKIILNLFSESINILNPIGFSKFISISSILYLFIIAKIIYKKKFNLSNDFIFLTIIFCIIYSVLPFVQHRYFLPLYPVLLFIIFNNKQLQND